MKISRYRTEHEEDVLSAIKADPDWDIFTNDAAIDHYKKALKDGVACVCYSNGDFCGYLRALLDDGFAVYISELFVVPKHRNQSIGRTLLAQAKTDFSNLAVYTLSDEDAYYEKIGYKKIGSVFEL